MIADRLPLPRPVLLWFGVFGAPFAWTAQHVAGYALTAAACNRAGAAWEIDVNAWTIAVTATAAAIAVLSVVTAVVFFVKTSADTTHDPPPAGRVRFLAIIGMAVGPLFLAIILMSGSGVLGLEVCHQS